MALGCLALSAGLSAALAWQSTRSSVVPYVVEVDNLGAAQAVAPALAEYRPTDPQIAWHLARFVENVRQVPADPIVLRESWLTHVVSWFHSAPQGCPPDVTEADRYLYPDCG